MIIGRKFDFLIVFEQQKTLENIFEESIHEKFVEKVLKEFEFWKGWKNFLKNEFMKIDPKMKREHISTRGHCYWYGLTTKPKNSKTPFFFKIFKIPLNEPLELV